MSAGQILAQAWHVMAGGERRDRTCNRTQTTHPEDQGHALGETAASSSRCAGGTCEMTGHIFLAIAGAVLAVMSCAIDSDDAWFPFGLGIILVILGAVGWWTA